MSPNVVLGYYADQGAPQAFGKSKQFTTKRSKLAYLTAYNKGASTVYIELYDQPTATGTPRTLPCPANSWIGWSQLLMRNGIFVQAMDAASGGSAIAGDDVKFDCGYLDEAT